MTASLASQTDSTPAKTVPHAVSMAELYRQMWAYAKGARGWLLLSSLMLVASQLVKLLVPWFAARSIEILQKGHAADCIPWVGGIFAVYVVCWLLHGPGRVIERTVALRVRRALTDRLYARIVESPLAWHGEHHSAELAHRMSQASQALSNFTQTQFIYLQNAVNLLGPLVALSFLSGLVGAVAFFSIALVALTIVLFDRTMMKLARAENQAERRHTAATLDCLSNILTVLSLRLQGTTRRLLTRRLDAVVVPLQRSITMNEWKWCVVDLTTVMLNWGLVALFAWRSHGDGAMMLGGVFMVYQYAQQAGGVIGSLASNLQNFARMRIDFASAAPIWDAPRDQRASVGGLVDSEADAQSNHTYDQQRDGTWRHIDLCELTYEHPRAAGERRSSGIRNVSLRLHPGERIALIGPSGSGKSTLLRLLAGLSEPTRGHIEIDGATSLGRCDLRHCSTLIAQEVQVFEATLRENIAFDLQHDDLAIHVAARIASLDSVIRHLPLGLDTPIGQGGSNLSGGQRQRLCLTRGILAARNSSVLLLDEPTSALDPVTEASVYDRMSAAFPHACIVASVHRMSLLDRFDRVVLIAQGRIVDVGTPEELHKHQPLFRQMLGAERDAEGSAMMTLP
jgi:ATP-binding cassette subfamily B protein